MVFQGGWRNGGKIQPFTEGTELLCSLEFCAWYVIADSVPSYNINNTCIKRIKAMFQAKKGSKNTCLKGMDEFLQTELEVNPTRATRHGEKPAEESRQKCSQGVAKRTQPKSTDAGTSKKKTT